MLIFFFYQDKRIQLFCYLFLSFNIYSITKEEAFRIENKLISVFKHQSNIKKIFSKIIDISEEKPFVKIHVQKTMSDFLNQGLWLAKKTVPEVDLQIFKKTFLDKTELNKLCELEVDASPVQKISELNDGFFVQTQEFGYLLQAKNSLDLIKGFAEKIKEAKKIAVKLSDYIFVKIAGTTAKNYLLGLKNNLSIEIIMFDEKKELKRIPIKFYAENGDVDVDGNFFIQDVESNEIFLGKSTDILLQEDYLREIFAKELSLKNIDFIKTTEEFLLSQKQIMTTFLDKPNSNIENELISASLILFNNFTLLNKIKPKALLNINLKEEFLVFLDLIEKIQNKIFQEIATIEGEKIKPIKNRIIQKEYLALLNKLSWFYENLINYFKEMKNTKIDESSVSNSENNEKEAFCKTSIDKINQIILSNEQRLITVQKINESISKDFEIIKNEFESFSKNCDSTINGIEKRIVKTIFLPDLKKLSDNLSKITSNKEFLNFYSSEIKLNADLLNQDKKISIQKIHKLNLINFIIETLNEKSSVLILEKNILTKLEQIRNKVIEEFKKDPKEAGVISENIESSKDLINFLKLFIPLELSFALFFQQELFNLHDEIATLIVSEEQQIDPSLLNEVCAELEISFGTLFEYLKKIKMETSIFAKILEKEFKASSTELFLFFKSNFFSEEDLKRSQTSLSGFLDLLSKNISTNLQELEILEKTFDILFLYLISPLKIFNLWKSFSININFDEAKPINTIIESLLSEIQINVESLIAGQNQPNLLKELSAQFNINIIKDLSDLAKPNNEGFFSELSDKSDVLNKIYFLDQFSFLEESDQLQITKNIVDQLLNKKTYWEKMSPYVLEISSINYLKDKILKLINSFKESEKDKSLVPVVLKQNDKLFLNNNKKLLEGLGEIQSIFKKYQDSNFKGIPQMYLEKVNIKSLGLKLEKLINELSLKTKFLEK